MVFQQKLLGKAYYIVKITTPAMIWPVSSNKWKAPLVEVQTDAGYMHATHA